MPMDYSRYPANWKEISHRIRFERAGGCCEWCGARHDSIIQRLPDGTVREIPMIIPLTFTQARARGYVRVTLTTAHLGIPLPDGTPVHRDDTMDCRDENLAALCQTCHLEYDRRNNWRRRRRVPGQLELWNTQENGHATTCQ